jgi:hypothetical protein
MSQPRKRNFDRTDELPTAADYIAAGAAPLLIMVMVGALVWFAQDLVYRGEHALRLRWTLFWFVIGMVGISRIAIERTPAYAGLFALGLGGAVAIMINQFFVMPPAGWLLLGLIWWCTNKLVWDCTLIDDKEDASGEWLLEVAGIDETAGHEARADVAVTHIQTGQRTAMKPAWWQRLFLNRAGRSGQPHAHGLWIIYFSLAALPLFGFGQAALASTRADSPGLLLLAVYLAAATGLLLLTSFLGLRRYLRQRRLKMPAAIAGTWVGIGAIIALGVLLFSFVLPRPVMLASSSAANSNLPGRQLDEQSTLNDPDADKESTEAGEGDQAADSGDDSEEESKTGPAKEQPVEGKQGGGLQERETDEPGGQSRPALQLPPPPDWLRWLGWALVGCVILYVVIRHWREIVEAIQELIASLRGLFQSTAKGRQRGQKASNTGVVSTQSAIRFADLTNPFQAGGSVDPTIAVRRTYEALELWAAERGAARAPESTATEFAQNLMNRYPELSDGIRRLTGIYTGMIYAERTPVAAELPPLSALWSALEKRQPQHVPR